MPMTTYGFQSSMLNENDVRLRQGDDLSLCHFSVSALNLPCHSSKHVAAEGVPFSWLLVAGHHPFCKKVRSRVPGCCFLPFY